MNNKIVVIGVLVFGAFLSLNAKSAVMTSGCLQANTCTLDELSAGGSINVGGVDFADWSDTFNVNEYLEFALNGSESFGELDTSNIFVQGIDAVATANPNEFTLGLLFESSDSLRLPQFFDVNELEESELELDFSYSATATDAQIVGARLEMIDVSLDSDDSFFEINQTLEGLFDLQVYSENFNGTDSDLVDEAMLAGFSGLDLNTNIQGGTFIPGSASLSSFAFYFTVVRNSIQPPTVSAPSMFLLSLFGLMVLVFGKRKP